MARKSFSIHSDYYNEIRNLTAEQRGMLLLALIAWANDDDHVELDLLCGLLFRMMTSQIERISAINAANGKKRHIYSADKNEISEVSEDKRIKPPVSDTVPDSIPDTDSVSNNNIIIEKSTDKDSDKTDYGKHKNVLLSDEEYQQLLSELKDAGLRRGIANADQWISEVEYFNPNTDMVELVRDASTWKVKRKSGNIPQNDSAKNYTPSFTRRR
jgi:hypothetical protein